jgi:hypothetical protein
MQVIAAPLDLDSKQLQEVQVQPLQISSTIIPSFHHYCPDGADPMKEDVAGETMMCGSGTDGHEMCPNGYFCSISVDGNSRLCCPMMRSNQNAGLPQFGHEFTSSEEKAKSTSTPKASQEEFDHMIFEKMGQNGKDHVNYPLEFTDSLKPINMDQLMNMITKQDPFDFNEESTRPKLCLLQPNEGRSCRADEEKPFTNLKYFYNYQERRCKVFFHKGCGGNSNLFNSKKECERRCH